MYKSKSVLAFWSKTKSLLCDFSLTFFVKFWILICDRIRPNYLRKGLAVGTLGTITSKNIDKILSFLQDEVTKRGFSKVVLGLSGGIDSAVVALLCKKAFGENMHALCMPSISSSQQNLTDAKDFCARFSIPYTLLSIAPYQKAFLDQNAESSPPSPLRVGNFCARIRMTLLYDFSQAHRALVIGTSNRSELMLGYGTIHGDLACALNPIAPFYKTQIFALARLLDIPRAILEKAPSADLYPQQSDEKELGYSYEAIDPLLACISQHYPTPQSMAGGIDKARLVESGFAPAMVDSITARITANLFKQSLPLFLEV